MNRSIRQTRTRRGLVVAAGAAAAIAGAFAAPTAAFAADPAAALQIAGPGTAFTATGHIVSQAVKSGSAASYTLRVLNTGSLAAGYYLKLASSGHASTVAVTTTTTNIWGQTQTTTVNPTSDGYPTGLIGAGKSKDFTLSVTPDKSNTQTSNVDVTLVSGSTVEGTEATRTSITAVNGTGGYDVLAHQGSQLNVGGAVTGQFATAPALAAKGSATYTLRLQNDSSNYHRIGLVASVNSSTCATSFPAKYTITTKNIFGQTQTTDITSSVNDGSYLTPYLSQGQYQDVTVSISRADSVCGEAVYTEKTQDGAGTAQMSAVLVANASV